MKIITCISAGAFILFSAFVMKKRADQQSQPPSSSLYDHNWSLKKIVTSAGEETVLTKAFIQFDAGKKTAGGNGSCNRFGSSFSITDNAIRFTNIFSTKMYCDGVQQTEDAFFKQLEKTNRFEIKDKKLSLYQDKDLVLEFERE